ncbi:sensor histidine kinase [uncultured Tenacibaculum sp.]|uniref:sensor histidine kinase n=1 Tax=uncultured Tenacibaculum sp. TaxID=174713 RepID=UPI00260F9E3B|nr:sensor histidine kinase [uncultured Tenacibaculum sp.]
MRLIIIFFFFLISHQTYSQSFDEKFLFNKSIEKLVDLDFNFVKNNTSKHRDKPLLKNIYYLNDIIENSGYSKSFQFYNNNIDTISKDKRNKCLINLIKGYNELYYNIDNPSSFQYFFQAYTLSKETRNTSLIQLSLFAILKLYGEGIIQNNNKYKTYLKEFNSLANTTNLKILSLAYEEKLLALSQLYGDETPTRVKEICNQLELLISKTGNKKIITIANYTLVNCYIKLKRIDQVKKIISGIIKNNNKSLFYKPFVFNSFIKLSFINYLQQDINKSFIYLDSAKKHKNQINSLKPDFIINSYLSEYYSSNKKDSAYYYLKKANQLQYKLNFLKSNEIITFSEVQNQTKETEKKFLKEQQENQLNQSLLFATLIFLLLGIVIVFLILKNSKRKRLLAEQQKELEKQKNLTLLKEQEINTINAMVTGQEKERIRIAEDLHDNIGSVLATLKLHFENLKLNREKKHFNQDELYERTEKLIDETYLKVRSIAHAKNAGVIANQGLLVAVKIMAEKISAANQLKIEIIDFGLEQRLDTNTEITLFRIIQELTTNIIKHAEASEATINISQFNDALNIIIEDNGKGFDSNKIKVTTGMGLHSIQKRIEHLGGTFQIDSSFKSGTSIIMNIPT